MATKTLRHIAFIFAQKPARRWQIAPIMQQTRPQHDCNLAAINGNTRKKSPLKR
jgi:hypothetical protein